MSCGAMKWDMTAASCRACHGCAHSAAQQDEMILYWQGEMQVLILRLVCSTDGVRNALGIRNAFCGFRRP